MAKLMINQLGAVHSIDIEIKQLNLFIGEQATGKSTLCKAVYFFRSLKEMVLEHLYSCALKGKKEYSFPKVLNHGIKDSFIKLFGYSWGLPDDLFIQYEYCENHTIGIRLVKERRKYLSIEYSEELIKEIQVLERMSVGFHAVHALEDEMASHIVVAQKSFFADLEKKICDIFEDDMTTYYIPAGRSMLSLLANQKTKLSYEDMEPLNRKFMQRIESLQPKFANGVRQAHKQFPSEMRKFDIAKMTDSIVKGVKGEYFYNGSKEYILLKGAEERIPIDFTSSGQQEVLWLYNQLYILMLKEEKAFLMIEEPEAHLYPSLQRDIFDFIVAYLNLTGGAAIVTTHSPYILTECNNLCYAGKLVKNHYEENTIEKLVGKWHYLDVNRVGAFKLNHTDYGTEVISLIDEETQELMAEKIDEISQEINQIYTGLYYLEEGL